MTKIFEILWDAVKLFKKLHSFRNAAAISFFAFLSIIPLMLLIASALGVIMGKDAAVLDKVVTLAKEAFPYASESIIGDLKGLPTSWQPFSWLGLIALLYGANRMLGATADALTEIFETTLEYGFFKKKIIDLIVFFIFIVMAFLSITMTAAAKFLSEVSLQDSGQKLLNVLFLNLAFKLVIPFFLMAVTATLVYRMFSGTNMNIRYAIYGSLIFTSLWETVKQLFAWYILHFSAYSKFYGSLEILTVFLIWIFYTANIFLFSAAIARTAYRLSHHREGA
jgi:membrane protein